MMDSWVMRRVLALVATCLTCGRFSVAFVGSCSRIHNTGQRLASTNCHSWQRETTTVMSNADTDGEQPSSRTGFVKTSMASIVGGATLMTSPSSVPAIGDLFEFKDQPRFLQHVVVNVPDMDKALDFYVRGLGMQVLRTRADDLTNTTFVGYGPEILKVPPDFRPGVSSFKSYGGHFSFELSAYKRPPANEVSSGDVVESDDIFFDPGSGVQFIQIAVEEYRISKLVASGGTVLSGYGYLEVLAPGGLKFNLLSGERRDPPMFVGVKVKDLQRSVKWYTQVLGMKEFPYPLAREKDSPYEPVQPKGSVFMAYDAESPGMLLIPSKRGEAINVGSVYSKLAVLAEGVEELGQDIGASFVGREQGVGTRVAVTADPDGYGVALVEYEDWVKELLR